MELTARVDVPSSSPQTVQGGPASYARSAEQIGQARIEEHMNLGRSEKDWLWGYNLREARVYLPETNLVFMENSRIVRSFTRNGI